jgi:hypothetical protein
MKLMRLLTGFGAAALFAELVLHAFPVSTGYSFLGVDAAQPILRGAPHARYVYSKNWNFRLHNSGQLNNYGFRATRDYHPDDAALVVVGNSYVVADAIPPFDNMTEQLGRLLGRPTYAIGGDGFSLADYLVAARWAARTFWPGARRDSHTIVVLLTTGDLNHSCDPRTGEHYLRIDGGRASIELVPRATPTRLKDWVNESMLFRYVFDNLRAATNWSRRAGGGRPGATDVRALPPGGCAASERAAIASEFLLRGFEELASAQGATVVFLLSPGYRREQNYEPGAMRDVDAFAARAGSAGFRVVTLNEAFASALRAGSRIDFLPIDGHWNVRANTIAARVLAGAVAGPMIAHEPAAAGHK